MTRIVFSDFDEFADSIRGIAGRFVPTARSQADWWVDASRLGRVDLQHLQILFDFLILGTATRRFLPALVRSAVRIAFSGAVTLAVFQVRTFRVGFVRRGMGYIVFRLAFVRIATAVVSVCTVGHSIHFRT